MLVPPEVLSLLLTEPRVVPVKLFLGFEASVVVLVRLLLFSAGARGLARALVGPLVVSWAACFERCPSGIVLLSSFFVFEDVVSVADGFELVFMAWIFVWMKLLG